MTEGEFRQKVYGPYRDAWKIIALLQYCSKTNNHENWAKFKSECYRFSQEAADNPFAQRTARFLFDCAEDIAQMNEGKNINEQTNTE